MITYSPADSLDPEGLHRRLDRWAKNFCPILGQFRAGYHWSFMQVELHPPRAKQGRSLARAFATDVILHSLLFCTRFQG